MHALISQACEHSIEKFNGGCHREKQWASSEGKVQGNLKGTFSLNLISRSFEVLVSGIVGL